MSLPENRITELLEETHVSMENQYIAYDRHGDVSELGTVFMQCVDKEGFIVPFEQAWQWVGYAKKSHAKRKIIKHLKEGVDYIILKGDSSLQYKYPSLGSAFKCDFPPGKKKQNGGQNKEYIFLTSRGFGQFAMAAQTSEGQMLRDFLMLLAVGVKRLSEEIKAGTVELKRPSPEPAGRNQEIKRLKVCESNKSLMQTIMGTGPANAALYGKVNGATNKMVTGRYKYETAKLLGKKPSQVNARDYMTPAQLAIAEAAEILSREEIEEKGIDASEALETHQNDLAEVTGNIAHRLHGKILKSPRKLADIRKKQKQIAQ